MSSLYWIRAQGPLYWLHDAMVSYESYCTFCIMLQPWTHWPLRDVEVILKEYFWNSFYKLVSSSEIGSRRIQKKTIDDIPYTIDDKSTLVQVMAWCRQATSRYLIPCWPRPMSPYGVTRQRWAKQNISETFHEMDNLSSFFLMLDTLIAPSHQPNQCWPIISKIQRNFSQCISIAIILDNNFENEFPYHIFEMTNMSPRVVVGGGGGGQWVNSSGK